MIRSMANRTRCETENYEKRTLNGPSTPNNLHLFKKKHTRRIIFTYLKKYPKMPKVNFTYLKKYPKMPKINFTYLKKYPKMPKVSFTYLCEKPKMPNKLYGSKSPPKII